MGTMARTLSRFTQSTLSSALLLFVTSANGAWVDYVGTPTSKTSKLVAGSRFPVVELLQASGAGTNADSMRFGAFPQTVLVADVDGDGDQDLISGW